MWYLRVVLSGCSIKIFIMKKLAALFVLGVFLSVDVMAQENGESINVFSNEFGFNVGASTGVGFSYRHWGDKFGIQATFLPFKDEENTFISGGLTAMFTLRRTNYVRTYLYWGNHVLSNSEQVDYEDYTYINGQAVHGYYSDSKVNTRYNTGFGIGFSLGRVVAFNIAFGYGAYNLFSSYDDLSLLPTGEIGLYWKF